MSKSVVVALPWSTSKTRCPSYADDEVGIELLCSRPGAGALTLNGEVLPMKGAKPLPASD
jgi:hypothetical protein